VIRLIPVPVLVLVLVLVSVLACRRGPPPLSPPPATPSAPQPRAPAPPAFVDEPDPASVPDPAAGTVTIKLVAEARRQAHVFWGRKDLGVAPLEITRPRSSGPLDLVVVAAGCLPLHTRVFTDRDDKIALRLYGESEGPTLLGYRQEQQPQP
jgi:hypothetical protein